MALVNNGEIVVIHGLTDSPIGGRVFVSNEQGATILRPSLNGDGEVWFLETQSIVVPNHKLDYVEPLRPMAPIRLVGDSYVNSSVNPEDNQRVIDWFASKGVSLS